MGTINISRTFDKLSKRCRTFDETMIREDGTVDTDYYGVDTGLYARYSVPFPYGLLKETSSKFSESY